MKIAVCDDDRDFCIQAVRMIREALERRGTAADVEPFDGAATLLAARESRTTFDAYFLDILMPDMNGMELARAIRKNQPRVPIVFLTTSEDYALQAFSLDAVHYLLKPLETARLETAIERLLTLMPNPEDETLVVRMPEGDLRSVSLAKIVRTESEGHYQRLHLVDRRQVRCRLSSVELWKKLSPSGLFALANKGVLLGLGHIRSITTAGAVLENGETVPVSRRAFPDLRKAYFRHNCR